MIQLNDEQQAALDLMLAGRNIFLTGEAGTGKSTILREFRQQCGRDCVFLAPTGVAAININGTTLHSFFLLKPGLLTPDNLGRIGSPRRKALLRGVKTIVVDEVSMLRSDVFAAIDSRLRSVAQGNDSLKPFGGKQMILVGDFFQLPPVIKNETERDYLQSCLGGAYAFQTQLWRQADFQNICLQTAHRQQDDRLFLDLLNNIRHGRPSEPDIVVDGANEQQSALAILNRCCVGNNRLPGAPICLCTTNREAATINSVMKARLAGNSSLFKAVVTGRFNESDFPTEALLDLKPGARVMVLCNKHLPDGEFEYVNGDVGVIMAISQLDSPAVTVKLDKGVTVTVGLNTWSNYEYVIDADHAGGQRRIRQREIGTFVQIPLKLAYAVTIHKAQGLSLDCVDLRLGAGCFAHGQLYTALSRCRRLQTLRVDRPIMPDDLILDHAVIDFYASLGKTAAGTHNVTMAIPPEHAEAVRAFLAQLQADGTGTAAIAKTDAAPSAVHARHRL